MEKIYALIFGIISVLIISSCAFTVEDQQGEKYKVDIQKVDEKKEIPIPINKNVPAIVDEEIKVIQLTDNSVRESVPKISQNHIIWTSIEKDELYNWTLNFALYNTDTGLTKKLNLWDKKWVGNMISFGGEIEIYKNWIAYSISDKGKWRGTGYSDTYSYKVYLYDIDNDKSYLIYEEKEGLMRQLYFDNGIIIIDNRWADFSKILSRLDQNNFDLFEKIPVDCCPNYYFDGKNVYYGGIGRYDTSLGKVTGTLFLPHNAEPTKPTYGFPLDANRVIYVDNKLKIVNFETDLVEDFKFDFDLQGIQSSETMFYDKDDDILIVPHNSKVFALYLNSGKKREISIVKGVDPSTVDYDEDTNILTWVDIRDQYSGKYLSTTDVADIYMAKIPKN